MKIIGVAEVKLSSYITSLAAWIVRVIVIRYLPLLFHKRAENKARRNVESAKSRGNKTLLNSTLRVGNF